MSELVAQQTTARERSKRAVALSATQMSRMTLVPIQHDGTVEDLPVSLPSEWTDVLAGTSGLYQTVGFNPPWICYIAIQAGVAVGTCGFKSAPANGRVEIAYFTFPQYEGRGVATSMARELVEMTTNQDSTLTVAAQTLPIRSASHRVLQKSGFLLVGSLEHPEDGTVFEWHRKAVSGA